MKSVEAVNKALMTKLNWRMLTEGDETWIKIMRSKYGLSLDRPLNFKHKNRALVILKGME